MVTDSIGDFIIQIKNGYMAGKTDVVVPYTKLNHKIGDILVSEKYIGFCSVLANKKKKQLTLTLIYKDKKPVLDDLLRISKPGSRMYVQKKEIPRVLSGRGRVILSTSKGVMTGETAKKQHVGGEILFKIW